MIRKNIRFYEKKEEDRKALSYIDNCEQYGFATPKDLIVMCINTYFSEEQERLAKLIADRVIEKITGVVELENNSHAKDEDFICDKAMSFIESLY